jgi:hypothetical protein
MDSIQEIKSYETDPIFLNHPVYMHNNIPFPTSMYCAYPNAFITISKQYSGVTKKRVDPMVGKNALPILPFDFSSRNFSV